MARVLEDETVLLDTLSGEYFLLNETGSEVWSRLDTAVSIEALTEHLATAFEVSRHQAHRDVVDLLDALESRGLITVAE